GFSGGGGGTSNSVSYRTLIVSVNNSGISNTVVSNTPWTPMLNHSERCLDSLNSIELKISCCGADLYEYAIRSLFARALPVGVAEDKSLLRAQLCGPVTAGNGTNVPFVPFEFA